MEDGAEALKIGFAIFMFVVALTVALLMLSNAKSTSDVVFFHTDKTNFQSNYDVSDENIVKVDNVIATLFRYYKESISVKILDQDNNIIAIFDTAIEKNCPWRASNNKTIERIKKFVTGEGADPGEFCGLVNYYGNLNNYNANSQLLKYNGVYPVAEKSLINLVNDAGRNIQNAEFEQTYIDVKVDGKYHTADNYYINDPAGDIPNDGSQIQITPGASKVYIIYKLHI